MTQRWLPALILLALVFCIRGGQVQAQVLPDAPPVMPARPKPTPKPVEPKDEDFEVVRVTSNLVVVPVSVMDASGQPVLGLPLTEFRLEEEGRAQEIVQLGNPEQVPLEIAILLDVSGSINTRFEFEKEAAARFLRQVLKAEDRAVIYTIDNTPNLRLARATADVAANRLRAIPAARQATAFYDTVIEAARHLAQTAPPDRRRVIVVISDGEDNYSQRIKAAIGDTAEAQRKASPLTMKQIHDRAILEVQRELQRAEVTFYSINPSGAALRLNVISQRAQDGMAQLARATGGNSFVPEQLAHLDLVFRQITGELRSQYLLQYYSAAGDAPVGKFLRIKVTVPARPQLQVRARQGYYVKRK